MSMPAPRVGPGTYPPVPADGHPNPDQVLNVLVERIASSLANHEPGWRLPRASELARRHNVTTEEVHAAYDELVARQLARQAADGEIYRASPADYLISVNGLAGLSAIVDPMGRKLTCLSYGAARQPAPETAANALRVRPGEPVSVLRLVWAVDGAPAAVSTTYLARHRAQPQDLAAWLAAAATSGSLPVSPSADDDRMVADATDQATSPARGPAGPPPRESVQPSHPLAVSIQMDLPPVSVARRLRLRPGQLALLVTVVSRPDSGSGPAGLTATVLRPDMFNVSLVTASPAPDDDLDPGWALAAAEYRM
jgi:DNA-binding GntR family transcriptional regulator